MNSPTKILLCAYACEPDRGSEPGVGWDTSINLAKHDIESEYYVLTRKNNRESIESKEVPENLNFIYYELPKLLLFIKRKGNFVRIYYYIWMLGGVVRLWKRRNEFKIIHHLTFVNDWLPSLFILLKTKKNYFVWGSIGSHNPIAPKFLYSTKQKITEFLRIFLQNFYRTFDLFFWRCKLKSDIIIGINDNVKSKLKLKQNQLKKFKTIPAIAIDNLQLLTNAPVKEKIKKEFSIISVGRLMYIKNFRLIITSFFNFLNQIPNNERSKVKLTIIGEGVLKKELTLLVKRLNIEDNICFVGQTSQLKVMEYFKNSDIFLFPTLESAGFVILEAMANSLPIVALDYGGPKQFIKNHTDLQLVSKEENLAIIENNLAQRILHFYNNFESRKVVGISNFEAVNENFTWKKKTLNFLDIYQNLLQKDI